MTHEPVFASRGRNDLCAMTHSYVCYDSFMCVSRFIHKHRAITLACVCHKIFIFAPLRNNVRAMTREPVFASHGRNGPCAMTYPYMCQEPSICESQF